MPKHKKKAKHAHQSTSLDTTSNHHTAIPAEKIDLEAPIQQNTLESGNPSSPPTNPVMTSSQQNTTIIQETPTIMDITQPDKEHTTTNQKIPTIMDNNQPDLDDNQPNAPTEATIPLADIPTRSENDGEIAPTPQPTPNTLMPHTDETDNQDGSAMDTDSNHTIQDDDVPDKGKQPSYSQVVSGTKMTRATRTPNPFKLEREAKWTKQFNSALAKLRKAQLPKFDTKIWNRNKIRGSLSTKEGLLELIKYKLNTLPPSYSIPPAISMKFKHKDTAFFRSFTRTNANRSQHQIEFNNLFIQALDSYKKQHNVLATNKHNRNQIFELVRAKLAIDYLTNLNIFELDAWEITRYVLYLSNFAKINIEMSFDEVRLIVSEAFTDTKVELPENYTTMHQEIRAALPFNLPIENRQYLGSSIKILRRVFKFDVLPDCYIADSRVPLPASCSDLNDTGKKMFPITKVEHLKDLSEYRRTLQKYYTFTRIPDSYFQLPTPKPPLPLTPQELTPRLKEQFPFLPRNAEDFKEHVRALRAVYKFNRLPNDYLIPRKRLPNNPLDLGWKGTTFPMTTKEEVNDFLETIPYYYNLPEPLPLAYANFNYTYKPTLPEQVNEVVLVNITTPIKSRKELVIAAQALREHYYFHKIPESWIEIGATELTTKLTRDGNPYLPSTQKELEQSLKDRNITDIEIPIKKHQKIESTVDQLHEKFIFANTPSYLFDHLEDLPQPGFDLFEEAPPPTKKTTKIKDVDICMTEQTTTDPKING